MDVTLSIRTNSNFNDYAEYIRRIRRESDFSQVVLEGITAIQNAQKAIAPRGKLGNIPRNIPVARISRTGHTWKGVSRTTYGPAVFTNKGTGTHGPKGSSYPITQNRIYKRGPLAGKSYQVNIDHPGIKGTGWWEKGAEMGGEIALESFRRKVTRMLRR